MRLIALLAMAACAVKTVAPANPSVQCNDDSECPASWRCAPAIQRCVVQADDTAPGIISATAQSHTSVVVTFDEEIAIEGASFLLDGEAQISAASADGSTLTLTTTRLVNQRPYVLHVVAINDRFGNVLGAADASFLGPGTADTAPPQLNAPAAGEAAYGMAAALSWLAPVGAAGYRVQVATSSDFSDAETFDIAEASLRFTAQSPTTHYWRVRADVTTLGQWSEVRTFEAVDDSMHVYCATGGPCGPSGEIGNRSSPYRSVQRALDAAIALGSRRILIAARGGTGAYEELFLYQNGGVDVSGGYSPDFSQHDPIANPTLLSAPALTHRFVNVFAPTRIDGLHFKSTDRATAAVINCGEGLVVGDSVFELSPGLDPDTIGIAFSAGSGLGPRLERVTIFGDTHAPNIYAIFAVGTRVQLVDVDITLTSAGYHIAIAAVGSSVLISGGHLRLSGVGPRYGLNMGNGTSVTMEGGEITVDTPADPSLGWGLGVDSAHLTNNVVAVTGSTGARTAKIVGSTGVVEAVFNSLSGAPLELDHPNLSMQNNLIACGVEDTALITTAASGPVILENNGFSACPTLLLVGATGTTGISELNAQPGYTANVTSGFATGGKALSGVTGDILHHPRTPPVSIGAYEND